MSNLSTVSYSQQQNKEVYLTKLSELTPEHLILLQLFSEYTYEDGQQNYEMTKTVKDYAISELKKKNIDEALTCALFTDLQSKGMINEIFHNTWVGGVYTHHITDLGKTMLN